MPQKQTRTKLRANGAKIGHALVLACQKVNVELKSIANTPLISKCTRYSTDGRQREVPNASLDILVNVVRTKILLIFISFSSSFSF